MSRPTPVARACVTPASRAKAAVSPVMKSTMDSPKRAGGPSGSPVSER